MSYDKDTIEADGNEVQQGYQAWMRSEIDHDLQAEILADQVDDDDEPNEQQIPPRIVEFELSPGCNLSPAVKGLVYRHLSVLNSLLNGDDVDRQARSRILTCPHELRIVAAELLWYRDYLLVELGSVCLETPAREMKQLYRQRFDLLLLMMLFYASAIHGVDNEAFSATFPHVPRRGYAWSAVTEDPRYRHFFRIRNQQAERTPEGKDARRKRQRRYAARVRTTPEYRRTEAERKRAARVAARNGFVLRVLEA